MSRLRFYAAVLAVAATSAVAEPLMAVEVLIEPASMKGWKAVAVNGATGAFVNVPPGGETEPHGAFFGATGMRGQTVEDKNPGQVWIGTDLYRGTPLSSIDKLEYSTFTHLSGRNYENGNYARQPFTLQLAFTNDGGSTIRYIMHLPWGLKDAANASYQDWETHNAMASESLWYETNSGFMGNWSQILAHFPGAVLATPLQSSGWDQKTTPPGSPSSSGIGCSINFEIGARKNVTDVFGTESYPWWTETVKFYGYLDSFTFGINGVRATFHFVTGDAEAPTRTIRGTDALAPIIDETFFRTRFKVFGYAVPDWRFGPFHFNVWAGRGMPVLIEAPGHQVEAWDFVEAEGMLDPRWIRFDPALPGYTRWPILFSSPDDITVRERGLPPPWLDGGEPSPD